MALIRAVTFRLPQEERELLPGEEIWTRCLEHDDFGPPRLFTLRALFDLVQAIDVKGLCWSWKQEGPFIPITDLYGVMRERPWTEEEKEERRRLKAMGVPKNRIADIVLEFGVGEMAAKSYPRFLMLEDVLHSSNHKEVPYLKRSENILR